MLYWFSRWWLLRHNFTSGFRTGDVALFRMSVVISKPNSVTITQSAAEITVSDFEKQTSAILEFYFRFRLRPYRYSWHVILHQFAKFYPNRTAHSRRMTSCRFSRWRISAILDLRGPIMGSLKSPCMTCYRPRSVMETHSSKLLRLWENRVFAFWRQTDKQTNKQINRPVALSRFRCRELRFNKQTRHQNVKR